MNEVPYHHGDLRNALIEAAVEAIAAHGVDAVSLRSLARSVGVSHAAPYRHFESKGHLVAAVAEAGFELLDSLIKGLFEGADTRAAFRAAGAIYVRFAVEQPGYFRVMYGPTRLTAGYTADLDTLGPREMARYEAIIAPLCEGRSARGAVIAGWALVHGVATLVADGRLGPGMFGLADDDYEGLVRTITSSYLP